MTIEFITKRIDGKKAAVAKLEKKIARIEAAKATNWEKNPYYYHESDLKYALRDLEDEKAALAKYEAELIKEQNKAASRNIKVIIDFLEGWKVRMRAVYAQGFDDYKEAYEERRKERKAYTDWEYSEEYNKATREERMERRNEYRREERRFNEAWHWVTRYETGYLKFDWERFERDIKVEAERKYDFIIERTEEIVTKITDASYLRIGAKGDLNGLIKGTTGTAKVTTVGAGGYNIQCFHFRTLIHEMKGGDKA